MLRPLPSALPFEKLGDCASSINAVAGGNERALLVFDYRMAPPGWRRYTGTKLIALAAESSRSSAMSIRPL